MTEELTSTETMFNPANKMTQEISDPLPRNDRTQGRANKQHAAISSGKEAQPTSQPHKDGQTEEASGAAERGGSQPKREAAITDQGGPQPQEGSPETAGGAKTRSQHNRPVAQAKGSSANSSKLGRDYPPKTQPRPHPTKPARIGRGLNQIRKRAPQRPGVILPGIGAPRRPRKEAAHHQARKGAPKILAHKRIGRATNGPHKNRRMREGLPSRHERVQPAPSAVKTKTRALYKRARGKRQQARQESTQKERERTARHRQDRTMHRGTRRRAGTRSSVQGKNTKGGKATGPGGQEPGAPRAAPQTARTNTVSGRDEQALPTQEPEDGSARGKRAHKAQTQQEPSRGERAPQDTKGGSAQQRNHGAPKPRKGRPATKQSLERPKAQRDNPKEKKSPGVGPLTEKGSKTNQEPTTYKEGSEQPNSLTSPKGKREPNQPSRQARSLHPSEAGSSYAPTNTGATPHPGTTPTSRARRSSSGPPHEKDGGAEGERRTNRHCGAPDANPTEGQGEEPLHQELSLDIESKTRVVSCQTNKNRPPKRAPRRSRTASQADKNRPEEFNEEPKKRQMGLEKPKKRGNDLGTSKAIGAATTPKSGTSESQVRSHLDHPHLKSQTVKAETQVPSHDRNANTKMRLSKERTQRAQTGERRPQNTHRTNPRGPPGGGRPEAVADDRDPAKPPPGWAAERQRHKNRETPKRTVS
nr:hypothetical protein Iba_chr15bCG9750 [Ipomoea batatas]